MSAFSEEGTPTSLPPAGPVEKPAKSSKARVVALILITAFISAVIGGAVASFTVPYMFGVNPIDLLRGGYPSGLERAAPPSLEQPPVSIEPELEDADPAVAVARKVQPSVVNIRIEKVVPGFFEMQRVRGVGSGVVYGSDGYIITNHHVVEDADEIWVTLGGEPDVKGRVIGRDPETDIAVVKVDRTDLPEAELGSAKDLQVGELVVAIGSPYGFEHTVTTGVVSALHRNVTTQGSQGEMITFTDLIQTDAAINPGNSGGALCNAQGQIIGINTLIYSETGGYQGIGFAIPIDLAKDVVDELIKTGRVSHPYIGVLGQTVDRDIAREYKLSVDEGALIVRVVEGTPAFEAGVREGDIVVAFDGESIKSMDEFIAAIRSKKVGDRVKLTYVHEGKRVSVELTLAEKPRLLR